MFFSKLAIRRPVTILMIVLMILLMGYISFGRLTVDLLPDMDLPLMLVMTEYSGAGPHEVENMVTRPLEEAVSTVDDLDSVYSTSSRGSSAVVVMFDWGTDMDFAALHLREQVDMVKGYLPDEADEPMILQIDPDMMPVLYLGVSGDMEEVALKELADDTIKNRLERLGGVALCEVTGGPAREILVEVDPYQLSSYQINLEQINEVLRSENMNFTGGDLVEGQREYLVRTTGEFKDLQEMEKLVVGSSAAGPIFLGDVAEIKDHHQEPDVLNRMNGEPTITLAISKQADANTIQVVDVVQEELENLERELPGNISFEVALDQSEFIRQSIDNIVQMIIIGGILAALVLFLFLGNVRSTLIIALAMPVSVVATFVLMYFQGLTINMITMAGLALGIGMMVDNSIVILENIYRYRQLGESRGVASLQGSGEVSGAIIASTLTTMAVFLPVVFVGGIASILFSSLAWTVAFSLFASLAVALTVIPALSSKYLKVEEGTANNGVFRRVEGLLERIKTIYRKVLEISLRRRKLVVIFFLLLFVGTFLLVPLVGMEFFPAADTGEITIDVEMPRGTPLGETNRLVAQIESLAGEYEDVETVFAQVGAGGMFAMEGADSDRAQVSLILVEEAEREVETARMVDDLSERLARIPGAEITVQEMDMAAGMGTMEDPVQVIVKGDSLEVLEEITDDLAEVVRNVEGTRQVETSFDEGRPEFQVRLDRERAAALGINTYQLSTAVRNALEGQVVTNYRVEGEEIDVRVKGLEMTRESQKALSQVPLKTAGEGNIALGEVAEIIYEIGPSQIERDDQVRAAFVTSGISERDLGSVMEDIEGEMEGYDLPTGYMIEYGGEMADMMEAFQELGLALLLAICLVYMVMASQFESLLYPFIIMFSLPQTFTGVVLALAITGRTLNVSSFMGVIMLAGIVVNNAIVLVDYINILRRERGYERNEAIMEGGFVRLRPILMTTTTTILGMLPLAFALGEGAEMWAPMATVIIGGLLISTVVTLVLVPTVYAIADDVSNWLREKFQPAKTPTEKA